jgi:hypothetical protein
MNGFGEHAHEEDAFGPSKGGIVSSFDAFRKYHQNEEIFEDAVLLREISGTRSIH